MTLLYTAYRLIIDCVILYGCAVIITEGTRAAVRAWDRVSEWRSGRGPIEPSPLIPPPGYRIVTPEVEREREFYDFWGDAA